MIPWVATSIALVGTVLNCRKNKACFWFWLVTNAMWACWDVMNAVYARALLDMVQFCLAIYGIYEWNRR